MSKCDRIKPAKVCRRGPQMLCLLVVGAEKERAYVTCLPAFTSGEELDGVLAF